jgi:uncharacterized RmlC-like cupin family protein
MDIDAAGTDGAGTDGFHTRLHKVTQAELDPGTGQSGGMRRFAALSGQSVGSSKLWMGQTHVDPATASANHHHGDSETAIYVLSGTPEFVFLEGEGAGAHEVRLRAGPGDYVYVPPFVAHREENPDPDTEAVVVIARSTQEPIIINLESLDSVIER